MNIANLNVEDVREDANSKKHNFSRAISGTQSTPEGMAARKGTPRSEARGERCDEREPKPTGRILGPIIPRDSWRNTALRWLKFNAVGGMGIVVQFVALFVLKSGLQFNYLAATALAVEAAVVHNFIWHEQFTWADRVIPSWGSSLPRLARFNLSTGAVSIVGNLALMKVMVGSGHMNYLIANVIAIALCSVANFLVSEEWVFEE
jgi:putative flippase GtrA